MKEISTVISQVIRGSSTTEIIRYHERVSFHKTWKGLYSLRINQATFATTVGSL
jgi:hypothetical protein